MSEYMSKTEYARYKGVSVAWIGRLIKQGKISKDSLKFLNNKKRPLIIVDLADKDLQDSLDASRDAQREANAKKREEGDLFKPSNQLPKNKTIAGLSDEERAERHRKEFKEIEKLEKQVQRSELENTPKIDDSQAEWNKYWIMERGLKTALERKRLEKSLIEVSEAKGLVENFMNPIVKELDNMAYDLKNHFPLLTDDVVAYVADYIDAVKGRVQNNVF